MRPCSMNIKRGIQLAVVRRMTSFVTPATKTMATYASASPRLPAVEEESEKNNEKKNETNKKKEEEMKMYQEEREEEEEEDEEEAPHRQAGVMGMMKSRTAATS